MASEVIMGIFDKSLLVKTGCLIFYVALSFAQLFVSPLIIRDDTPE